MLSRNETVQIGTYNPGLKPFNLNHRSKGTVNSLINTPDTSDKYEVHHVMGVQDQLRPLVEGLTDHQQKAIMHRLLSKGVVFGQNPDNLIALGLDDHKTVHRHMEDIGLDSNLEQDKLRVINSIANLPYEQRLIAADTFAEQIYPGILQEMEKLGHKVPSIQDNIDKYNRSIEEERLLEIKKDGIRKAKQMYGSKFTNESLRQIRDSLTDEEITPKVKRMAGDVLSQLLGEGELTTGNVSGDKPIIVNADENASVYLHTNGKKGNGHVEMQEKFNENSKRNYTRMKR